MKEAKVDRLTVKLPMYWAQIEFYICNDYELVAKKVPDWARNDVLESTSYGTCTFAMVKEHELYRRPVIFMREHDLSTVCHEILRRWVRYGWAA